MTDIYVGEKKNSLGCLLLVLIVTAVFCFVYYLGWMRPRKAKQADELSVAEMQAEIASGETPSAESGKATVAIAPDTGLSLISEARSMKDQGDLLGARDRAYEILDASSNPVALRGAIELLGQVNVELVLTPRNMPEKEDYTVQPGDSLAALAKRYSTTIDAIRRGNRISGSIIRVNDRLRIFTGEFSIKVDKSDNLLDLFMNGKLFKRYAVGTGEFGRTPVGDFKFNDKIAQPTWWRPDGKAVPFGDPDNVLGTHWLSLDIPGYGIHGTWEPETIGKQASAGCIRLLNADVEELFTLVPEGTPVQITD